MGGEAEEGAHGETMTLYEVIDWVLDFIFINSFVLLFKTYWLHVFAGAVVIIALIVFMDWWGSRADRRR